MAELDLTEAIRSAAYDAADRTIDAIEQRKDLVFNGMFDPEVNEIAMAVLDVVAELIVADTRRQIAEEWTAHLIAHQRDYPGGHSCGWSAWGHSWAAHVVEQWQAAARGSGGDDSGTSKPTGAQPI